MSLLFLKPLALKVSHILRQNDLKKWQSWNLKEKQGVSHKSNREESKCKVPEVWKPRAFKKANDTGVK